MSEFIKEENKEKAVEEQVVVESAFTDKMKTLFKNNWGKILAVICSYILGVFGSDSTMTVFKDTLNTTSNVIELVTTLIKTDSGDAVEAEAEKIIKEVEKALEESKK